MPKEEIKEIFIKNLKSLRTERQMTLQELSERLGISRSTISMWERGYSMPRMEMLDKIADLFEIPVSDLTKPKKQGLNLQLFAEPDPDKEILDRNYNNVNAAGKKKIVEYSNDVAGNPKYTDEIK